MKASYRHFLFLLPLFMTFAEIDAQYTGASLSFNVLDKNNDRSLCYQEFKSLHFYDFDKNEDKILSRFEFWKLKQFLNKQKRMAARAIRNGEYPAYYHYALEPLIVYESPKENYLELQK